LTGSVASIWRQRLKADDTSEAPASVSISPLDGC
jgi:hypothetical protein